MALNMGSFGRLRGANVIVWVVPFMAPGVVYLDQCTLSTLMKW